MWPVLFKAGPVTVYTWGFMLSLAVIIGVAGTRWLARWEGIDPEKILDLAILLVIGGLLGARLFYVFFYEPAYYWAHPLEIFKLYQPGLVFHGGLLAGILITVWFVRRSRLSFWSLADTLTPFLALGYGITRIGCFFNGCCYGKPTGLPWGVVFPGLLDIPRHPTQLYSALGGFLLFAFLLWLFFHRRFRGEVFLSYLIMYSLLRFAIETWRENPLVLGPFTLAQVMSVVILALAAALYYQKNKEVHRKGGREG